mgnify:CR=1 FL=1
MGLPAVVIHAALLVTFDLADHPIWTLVLLALGFLALLFAVQRLSRGARPAAAGILLVAALLRLLLLPLPPSLSDDVLRYVWDGRVLAAGENPYRLAPEAPELSHLRDDLWRRMPHKEVPTVYPPLAVDVFNYAVARRSFLFSYLKAKAALARFVSLHPYQLEQKAEVIVEHFRRHVRQKIGGRAKAMVVTASMSGMTPRRSSRCERSRCVAARGPSSCAPPSPARSQTGGESKRRSHCSTARRARWKTDVEGSCPSGEAGSRSSCRAPPGSRCSPRRRTRARR